MFYFLGVQPKTTQKRNEIKNIFIDVFTKIFVSKFSIHMYKPAKNILIRVGYVLKRKQLMLVGRVGSPFLKESVHFDLAQPRLI